MNGAMEVAVDIIRSRSAAGHLVSHDEVLGHLAELDTAEDASGEGPEAAEVAIKNACADHNDLRRVCDPGGKTCYYSTLFMTDAYAGLLVKTQGDRLALIAGIVRENSAIYPRPTPLDLFTQPPFDLSRDQVLDHLREMGHLAGFGDIQQTTTSEGNTFLYSTTHLETDHAAMLAEWLDVGQYENH